MSNSMVMLFLGILTVCVSCNHIKYIVFVFNVLIFCVHHSLINYYAYVINIMIVYMLYSYLPIYLKYCKHVYSVVCNYKYV